jgi:flagellar FliL protein
MPEEQEIEEIPKKSKTMLIVIIAIVVNVAIVAVVLIVFVGGGSSGEQAAKKSADAAHPASLGNSPGPLVEMDNFVVNVNSDEGTKYLKAAVVVELTHETLNEPFEKWKQVIRNEMLVYLSSLEVDETRTIKQKRKIEGHLKGIVNKRVGADMVSGVYFTEFVTQ